MKIISIFQPNIRAYRHPFFESLAAEFTDSCVSIYFGGDVNAATAQSRYLAVKTPCGKFLKLFFQTGIRKAIKHSTVNIVGFDLHWPTPIFWGLLYRRRSNLLFWGHGFGRFGIAAFIKKRLVALSDGVIVYSPNGKERLVRAGIPHEKVYIAPNTMFVPNHEDTSDYSKDCFLYVGRLQDRKRLDWLLHAFAMYREQGGNKKLVLVGDGAVKADLEQIAKELGQQRSVKFFLGTTDDEQLKTLFQNAGAYVSPGHVGLGVLHAFSYGVPVLTMENRIHAPEYEWLEHNYNGIKTAVRIEDYCKALLSLDNNELAKRLGKNAYCTYTTQVSPSLMIEGFKKAVLNE